jgi:hypothetical protein
VAKNENLPPDFVLRFLTPRRFKTPKIPCPCLQCLTLAGTITAPRNIEVSQTGQYSLAIRWDSPECGSIGEYQIEVSGKDSYAVFDIHRQTVTQPSVSISNLLPGTTYTFRVRAVDRSSRQGPWSDQSMTGRTEGRGKINFIFRFCYEELARRSSNATVMSRDL